MEKAIQRKEHVKKLASDFIIKLQMKGRCLEYEEEDNWKLSDKEHSFEGTHLQFIYMKDVKKFIEKVKEDVKKDADNYYDIPVKNINKIIDKRAGDI